MGTNYYVTTNPCPTCGNGEQFHFTKSFRIFRGYEHGGGPFGATIRSIDDWLTIINRTDVEIRDEYCRPIHVTDVKRGIARHDRPWLDNYHRDHLDALERVFGETRDTWQDHTGHTFSGSRFS